MVEMTLRESVLIHRALVQSRSADQLARELVYARGGLDLAAIHHGKDWAWLCVVAGQVRAEQARREYRRAVAAVPVLARLAYQPPFSPNEIEA